MKTNAIRYAGFPVVGSVSLLDGVNTTAQVIIPFEGYRTLGILETWDGTLTATLTLEISMNYDRRNPSGARWTSITDATIAAFLTTDPTATPAGGKPIGAPGSASLLLGSETLACAAIRWTATRTAGTGNYYLDIVVNVE